MATIRGYATWGQIPLWYSGYEMMNQQVSFNGNYLISANTPMIYQVIWTAPAAPPLAEVDEMYIPAADGDVMNIVFNVYATTEFPTPSSSLSDWELLGSIRKSRDIPNTNVVTPGDIPNSQSFTVDVSRLVADELSYSLVPIGKGSWQSQAYGGMNGGAPKQDNITQAISPYNVTANGMYRTIKVRADIEQLNADGEVISSTSEVYEDTAHTTTGSAPSVRVLNSVPSFSENIYNDQMRILDENEPTLTEPKQALTNCPNSNWEDTTPSFMKSVNIFNTADFLYFYVKNPYPAADPTEYYNRYEVYGQAYDADGGVGLDFVLGSEWENSLGTIGIFSDLSHSFEKQSALTFENSQNQPCVQNVSCQYINSHAYAANATGSEQTDYPYTGATITPITDDTEYYKVYVRGAYWDGAAWNTQRHSSIYYYSINREDASNKFNKQLFQNVTFHWLNPQGGIDTYTARRDILESISVSKSLMETRLPNRRYMQDNADAGGAIASNEYINDTMRGFDTYRGGTEVLSSNAKENASAYTEPLNAEEARWLREIFASPNVWVEEDTAFNTQTTYRHDAAYHMYNLNPTIRPATTIYWPIIITNTEVVSLDQANGLVKYNIEYTYSQGILTQSN